MSGTMKPIIAAFCGNLAIAVVKFAGAIFSGSSSLIAEGVHSLVDTLNEGFLFLGLRRQKKPPDEEHPLGYGRERFFWSFMASVSLFIGGGLFSIAEGVEKLMNPKPLESLAWSLGTLAFAIVAEGVALGVSFKAFRARAKELELSLKGYYRESRDPTLLAVLYEDAAAIVGVLLALAGVGGTALTGDGRYDGAGSIAIGLLLGTMAFILGNRNRALLIGASAPSYVRRQVDETIKAADFVEETLDLVTIQLAPDEIMLAAHLLLKGDMDQAQAASRMQDLEDKLARDISAIKHIFLEVQPHDERAPVSHDQSDKEAQEH